MLTVFKSQSWKIAEVSLHRLAIKCKVSKLNIYVKVGFNFVFCS